MRIVYVSSPKTPLGTPVTFKLGWVGNEYLVARNGSDLRVSRVPPDVNEPIMLEMRIPNVVSAAVIDSTILTLDSKGLLSVWRLDSGRWSQLRTFRIPMDPSDNTVSYAISHSMVLSQSGRYVLMESEPVSTGPGTWPVARAMLIDTVSGEVRTSMHLDMTWVRAGFGTLSNGQEVLFVWAESYMGVQMIECSSGKVLHCFKPTTEHDFCHTDYHLMAGGRRLWTFGCEWGASYESRLYDVTPWTSEGVAAASGFPLPLVHRQEWIGFDSVLPLSPDSTDNTVAFVSYVDPEEFPETGSKDEKRILGQADAETKRQYSALRALVGANQAALIVNRVDSESGQPVGTSIVPVGKTEEEQIHRVPPCGIMLVNTVVELVDGIAGSVQTVGSISLPGDDFWTLPSPDGKALAIWSLEA